MSEYGDDIQDIIELARDKMGKDAFKSSQKAFEFDLRTILTHDEMRHDIPSDFENWDEYVRDGIKDPLRLRSAIGMQFDGRFRSKFLKRIKKEFPSISDEVDAESEFSKEDIKKALGLISGNSENIIQSQQFSKFLKEFEKIGEDFLEDSIESIKKDRIGGIFRHNNYRADESRYPGWPHDLVHRFLFVWHDHVDSNLELPSNNKDFEEKSHLLKATKILMGFHGFKTEGISYNKIKNYIKNVHKHHIVVSVGLKKNNKKNFRKSYFGKGRR